MTGPGYGAGRFLPESGGGQPAGRSETSASGAPPGPVKLTLSDWTPYPGHSCDRLFKDTSWANHRITVYIDRPSNAVAVVTASPTGYGTETFALSKYAQVGSRHSPGVFDTAGDSVYYKTITVVAPPRSQIIN